jgi:SAM-dependent methyltransferase
MGTLIENQSHWAAYDWSQGGDEWSEVWGGSESLWWGTLFPRLRHLLPTGTLLEIAPGYGRFTRFLKDHCERLIGVDLTERCVEACRKRFTGDPRLTFHVNDGTSLPMVEDRSVDLAFSFDSLVHAEVDVLEAYLHELGRTLRADGVAVLHHSNMAAIRADGVPCDNHHWRAESVSAALVAEAARRASLACIGQEPVNWGGTELTDCISVLTPRGSRHERPLVRIDNPAFMAEATRLAGLARVYRP